MLKTKQQEIALEEVCLSRSEMASKGVITTNPSTASLIVNSLNGGA